MVPIVGQYRNLLFPLHAAAAFGQAEVVRWLFYHSDAHNDIHHLHFGSTPLCIALNNSPYNRCEDVAKFLILNEALSDDWVSSDSIDDWTMLINLQ